MEKKNELNELVNEIKKKIGKELLSDEDLLLLAAFEIYRTYTHEEKKSGK